MTLFRARLHRNSFPLIQVLFSAGILAAYVAGLPYRYHVDSVGILGLVVPWWRVMVGAAVAMALAQAACLWFCPESPSWLEARDKEKADEACIALWGSRAILFEDVEEDSACSEAHSEVLPLNAATPVGPWQRTKSSCNLPIF